MAGRTRLEAEWRPWPAGTCPQSGGKRTGQLLLAQAVLRLGRGSGDHRTRDPEALGLTLRRQDSAQS